jgi:transaldolase
MNYIEWLNTKTSTKWWSDTADLKEIQDAMNAGACGVTTNPVLAAQIVSSNPEKFKAIVKDAKPEEKAEKIMNVIVKEIAELFLPVFKKSSGKSGFVCSQVNPEKQADAKFMIEAAKRYAKWAPNIAVKIPGTMAGLSVIEECVSLGITVTSTVNFTVPQAMAVGENCKKGMLKAQKENRAPGKCFVAVMIGRLDDYLRDVIKDNNISNIEESDITKAGLAVIKRLYGLYKINGYEAVLVPAAMRGNYHVTEFAGAGLVLSVPPKIHKALLNTETPQTEKIEEPIDLQAINRLMKIPEFVRAYELGGMKPEDFITFGLCQRTLTQFVYAGWSKLASIK